MKCFCSLTNVVCEGMLIKNEGAIALEIGVHQEIGFLHIDYIY